MSIELIVFLTMVASFILGCFLFKLPVSVSMMAASVLGALVGGEGVPVRHLAEGTFAYVDTVLVIATAMIFMKVIEHSGALDALSSLIIEKFHKKPALLLMMIMLVIMFPGMVTGSSTAAILSAGSIMAPILLLMGIPKVSVAAILALGGLLGMIAPPTNIPAMIICGGIDMPFVGFDGPLLLLTIPLAMLFVLMLGLRHVRGLDYSKLEPRLDRELRTKYGARIYIPILALLGLLLADALLPAFPDVGTPLMFLFCALIGLFTGKKVNLLRTAKDGVQAVMPVMGILMGVGMFIQIMTLTGVRGLIVNASLSLPSSWRYVALGVAVPAFGAISAFGSSSVLGVPFMLAMLSGSQVITASAISLIAALGDLVPPTALAGMFAAQVVKVENYFLVLKKCLVPALILVGYGIAVIIFSKQVALLFGL